MTPAADADDTDRHRVIVSAVLVGGSAEFVARCRDTLAKVGVSLWNCGLESFAVLVARRRPPIIFVIDALFASDPVMMSESAASLGARLVRLPGERMQQGELESLLVKAVFDAANER